MYITGMDVTKVDTAPAFALGGFGHGRRRQGV